jgi:hypothetical protein
MTLGSPFIPVSVASPEADAPHGRSGQVRLR